MRKILARSRIAPLLLIFLFGSQLFGQTHEVTQFGKTIRIGAGQSVGEITCIMCSIYLASPASGDVTAIGGSVYLDEGAAVAGEVTAIGGNIRATSGVTVGGDVTALGGTIRAQSDVKIGGERTAMEGRWWLLLIFVSPLVVLGALIAGLVWFIRYLVRPTRPATA